MKTVILSNLRHFTREFLPRCSAQRELLPLCLFPSFSKQIILSRDGYFTNQYHSSFMLAKKRSPQVHNIKHQQKLTFNTPQERQQPGPDLAILNSPDPTLTILHVQNTTMKYHNLSLSQYPSSTSHHKIARTQTIFKKKTFAPTRRQMNNQQVVYQQLLNSAIKSKADSWKDITYNIPISSIDQI